MKSINNVILDAIQFVEERYKNRGPVIYLNHTDWDEFTSAMLISPVDSFMYMGICIERKVAPLSFIVLPAIHFVDETGELVQDRPSVFYTLKSLKFIP